MTTPISLNKIQMRVVSTSDKGEVNAETLFVFTQEDSMIWARYSGGNVRLGFLVGTIIESVVTFRYAQIENNGRIDGGRSTCTLDRTESGRIRLVEHFQWESRKASGTNIFEEITMISEEVEGIND